MFLFYLRIIIHICPPLVQKSFRGVNHTMVSIDTAISETDGEDRADLYKVVGFSSVMTQHIAQEDFSALVMNIYTNYAENPVVT